MLRDDRESTAAAVKFIFTNGICSLGVQWEHQTTPTARVKYKAFSHFLMGFY